MTNQPSPTNNFRRILSTARYGEGHAQYGEIFQGQIYREHRLRRCLVSLPCKNLRSRAKFSPNDQSHVQVIPSHKEKALKAALLTLEYCALQDSGGVLSIETDIPEAKGCGSSTADCVAAVLAITNAFLISITPPEIARLVVSAELASGNMMYRAAGLFAHREGVVLDQYSRPLPVMEILAFDTEEDVFVKTLEMTPAEYTPSDIATFEVLTADLQRAIEGHDLPLLGHIATASATINQRFLPKKNFDATLRLTRDLSALGIAVAHSGTVMSILFAPDDPILESKIKSASTTLNAMGIKATMRFST